MLIIVLAKGSAMQNAEKLTFVNALQEHFMHSWWVYALAAVASAAIGWPAFWKAHSLVLGVITFLVSSVWLASLIHTSRMRYPYYFAWAFAGVLLSFIAPLLFAICISDDLSDLPRWWMVMGVVFSIIVGVIVVKKQAERKQRG